MFYCCSSFPSCITRKLYSVCERSMHTMNALLSKTFLFLFRAACELWLVNYSPKHASQPLPICHFVHISSATPKTWGACYSTTHQMTPLLLRMLCIVLKAAKWLQSTIYSPVQTSLSCIFLQVRMTTKPRVPTTVLGIKQLLSLKGCIF